VGTRINAQGVTEYEGSLWWWALPQVALPLQLALAGGVLGAKVLEVQHHRAQASLGWTVGLTLGLGVALGFVAWTLFEYTVHRWLMHQTWHPVLRWLWLHTHKPHHAMKVLEDENHRALHPALALPIFLPWYLGAWWLGDGGLGVAVVAGFAVGYCTYELVHYLFHATDFGARFGHWAWVERKRAGHVHHHLTGPGQNFGFTTYFWDQLLGTYGRASSPHENDR
jgi:sterol desaturase/sphingolipid hydroxylase (fatty acid hydroxylase superfamily)